MTWSSLPVYACWKCEQSRIVRTLNERTLERINIKALVVPVESFFFECPFNRVPLRVVRCNDLVSGAFFLFEVFRDERDGLDLLAILMMRLAPSAFDATVATLTIRLVPPCC